MAKKKIRVNIAVFKSLSPSSPPLFISFRLSLTLTQVQPLWEIKLRNLYFYNQVSVSFHHSSCLYNTITLWSSLSVVRADNSLTASTPEGGKTYFSKKGCPGFDTKQHSVERSHFWSFGKCRITTRLTLLPVPQYIWDWLNPSMGQIDQFEND